MSGQALAQQEPKLTISQTNLY